VSRDSRYDILFEPLEIGPVTTKNRFYQVPHCTGMGWQRPNALSEMRGIKAEGGWGVINTEYCSIHPSSDDLLSPYAALWDDSDVRAHRIMTEKVHEHGALAGAELWYGGSSASNLYTRDVGFDVNSRPNWKCQPMQSRKMDKQDFRDMRQWYRDAALRARQRALTSSTPMPITMTCCITFSALSPMIAMTSMVEVCRIVPGC